MVRLNNVSNVQVIKNVNVAYFREQMYSEDDCVYPNIPTVDLVLIVRSRRRIAGIVRVADIIDIGAIGTVGGTVLGVLVTSSVVAGYRGICLWVGSWGISAWGGRW